NVAIWRASNVSPPTSKRHFGFSSTPLSRVPLPAARMIAFIFDCLKSLVELGPGQYHLAIAGGCVSAGAPTRYREVVLTRSKTGFWILWAIGCRRSFHLSFTTPAKNHRPSSLSNAVTSSRRTVAESILRND